MNAKNPKYKVSGDSRPKKPKDLTDIHQKALNDFDNIWSSVQDERKQCKEDRRFYSIAGAQWEGNLQSQFENKPRVEVNKTLLAVIKIMGSWRRNRVTVNFIPKNGEKSDKTAEFCDDLFRATEENSCAEEAYDNGIEEGIGGGIGAWRLRNEYEDEYDPDNDQQVIRIEPIFDADSSVFFDLNAKKYDKSDAKYAYIITSMTHESFIDEWGIDPTTWPVDNTTEYFDWCNDKKVYVAEYYKVEDKSETLYVYRSLTGIEEKYYESDFEDDENLIDTLQATGYTLDRVRKVKVRKIRKYILSGGQVLEDCGYVAGKYIPIVPYYGKRWYIDNKERAMGHIRPLKDVQRLKNMQMSKLAEIAALSSVEKPIFTPEQISGHEIMWSQDNIKDWPYLLLNRETDLDGNPLPSAPIAYTKPPAIPQSMALLLQTTDTDIKELLGNQEQGEQVRANLSGKAMELVQDKLSTQDYIYISNAAKSIKRTGEIWLSMAQDIFVEKGRKLKGVGEQGETKSIELMKPMRDEAEDTEYIANDITNAKLDVSVTVGPSMASKRESTINSLIQLLQYLPNDPNTQQVIVGGIIANMEGDGLRGIKKYFRNLQIRSGAAEPTEEEAKALEMEAQNQQPSPEDQYFTAEAEKALADAAKNRADTVYTIARAEETQAKTEEAKAKTLETLSGIETEEQRRALEASKVSDQISEKQSAS